MDKYVTKITPHIVGDRLRPTTTREWIMRVGGMVQEGIEEQTTFGRYVRWRGTFQAVYSADVVTPDGEVVDGQVKVISNEMILPDTASEYLAMYFTPEKRDLPRDRSDTDTRTGTFHVPKQSLQAVRFAIDLMLAPPTGKRPSTTGYVFDYSVILREETINPLAEIDALMGGIRTALPRPSRNGSGTAHHSRDHVAMDTTAQDAAPDAEDTGPRLPL